MISENRRLISEKNLNSENKMERGVGIILDQSMANRVKDITYKSDYKPTSQHTDEEVGKIYEDIEECMAKAREDFLVVMGD